MIGVESERTTFVSCTGESLHVERVSELRPDVASWVEAIRSRSSSDDAGCASVRDGRCVLIDGDHTVFEFSASGQQIEVWSDGTRSDRYLDHMLRDHVVPRRLSLRGERILHATAVAVHGVAVAFVGPSTAGKSTLAAAFAAEGATVLADDTLRLRLDTDRTLVLPTSDTSRLREDSAAALEAPMTAVRSRPLRSAENAVIVRSPVPLGLICLVDRGAAHLRLAPVAPSHALAGPRTSICAQARQRIEAWRIDYNEHRPHGALGHLTPSEYVKAGQKRSAEAANF